MSKNVKATNVPAGVKRQIIRDFISRNEARIGHDTKGWLLNLVATDEVLTPRVEVKPLRTATYFADRTLSYWTTPNSFQAVDCRSLEQARQLISETGIEQGLEMLRHGKLTNHNPTL